MLDSFLDALTGRRLGGALFVLLGVIVAAVVLWPEGDGDRDTAAKPRIAPVRIVSVPQLGISFAHPRAWRRTIAGRVIRLRSPERAAVLTFASPVEGAHTRQVLADLKGELLQRFSGAKLVREGPAKLGRRDGRSLELDDIGADASQRVLIVVASSAHRTYAVTLLTPARPSAKRLVEVQQILDTVRLSKPTAVASNG